MRRGAIVMLVTIAVLVGAGTTAVAVFVDWLPEQASEEREGIDFVFWLATWICISIFALVASVILYSVLRFRARPDDDSDGPPIHGHTGLEVVWTAVPALLVIMIGIASAIVLTQNDRAGDNPLRVKVFAQQFAWSFEYPGGVTSGTLRLPLDRSAELSLTARDVIHSFFVPQFGQKQDAVPGMTTRLVITPTRLGEFPVACYELCGVGHSIMRATAVVMRPNEFQTWLAEQRRGEEEEPESVGASVFESQGCGSCHAFEPAGSTGTIGPSLDELEAAAGQAGKPLEEFVRESIVDPNAYIHPGFQAGTMPETFAELPEEQIDALVQYLLQGAE